jgi:hypothetical protein
VPSRPRSRARRMDPRRGTGSQSTRDLPLEAHPVRHRWELAAELLEVKKSWENIISLALAKSCDSTCAPKSWTACG